MGTTSKGIMGDVNGKVGKVVGSKWRGKAILRSIPDVSKNAKRSNAQLAQQAKFALASEFLQGTKDLLAIGFGNFKTGPTGANKALGHMLKKAITGTYPDFRINYIKVLVSKGTLLNAFDAKASASAKEAISFSWTNNAITSNADENDQVLMAAYCPEFNCTVYRIGAARSTGSDALQMPGFSGRVVHTWVSFISADGEDIATSLYTGEVTIT
jgi:hypothetical protein